MRNGEALRLDKRIDQSCLDFHLTKLNVYAAFAQFVYFTDFISKLSFNFII